MTDDLNFPLVPGHHYWLSFCDPDCPNDGDWFLGAAVVLATGQVDAVRQAHRFGCNPGSKVAIVRLTDDFNEVYLAYMLNTLRSRVEIQQMGIC